MKSLYIILQSKLFIGVAFLFLSLNLCVGTWAISIPQIKEKIGFSESELGIAILFFGLGTIFMLLTAPGIINKIGLGKACLLGAILISINLLLPFLVTTYTLLCVSLFILGVSTGFTDIGMNTLVSRVEQLYQVNIMSASHGFFSLGGVISGGLGALCVSYFGEVPFFYVFFLSFIVLLFNLFLSKNYIKIKLERADSTSFDFNYIKPLIVLLIIGFISMAAEGAVADWSALYLDNISHASSFLLALGFLSFSVFMMLGRFVGDAISQKIGSLNIVTVGLITSILGFFLVLSKGVTLSILGFGLVGLGLSVIIPELFRIGGNYPYIEKSRAISLIAGSGYLGFLLGPVLFGLIADLTNLWWSFLLISLLISISLIMILFYKSKSAENSIR